MKKLILLRNTRNPRGAMLTSMLRAVRPVHKYSITAVRSPGFYGHRACSSAAVKEMTDKLEKALDATDVVVEDISGGCGSMYKLEVTSPMFARYRFLSSFPCRFEQQRATIRAQFTCMY